MKVDLGGVGRGGTWLTINSDDSGLRPLADITADIRECARELEQYLDPQSVGEMRCCHTLEHLDCLEVLPTLKYWRSFLRPGGQLLIVVPDIGVLAAEYVDGEIPFEVLAAVAHGDTPGYQRTRHPNETHKWSWDLLSLKRDLEEVGYVNVQMVGDEHWPSHWLFDYPAYQYTGLVGKWQVANLRLLAVAP